MFFFFQGNSGGSLCLCLCPGHTFHWHQGPFAIPDHHSRCQTEEQGIVGDLQRSGSVDFAVVSSSQPAGPLLLPVDPKSHGAVYLEETSL